MTNPDGLKILNQAIIYGINGIVEDVASLACITSQDIVDMTIVGNTCMHSFFLNPYNIGRAPFSPVLHHSLSIKARELGMKIGHEAGRFTPGNALSQGSEYLRNTGLHISPGTYVYILPIEAGFVGADNVGVLIAEEPHKQDIMELIIDIRTNGEFLMGNRHRLISSSCATGPAFEGAKTKYGMRSTPGAIDKVVIDSDDGEVCSKVIGKDEWNSKVGNIGVKGICGSGIIDEVAQLFLAGIIDRTGRFTKRFTNPRLRKIGGMAEYVIAWATETSINKDIAICQGDIRTGQLAKGAMYKGARIMMRVLGKEKLDKVILAGAFSSYIDKESAAVIGLFPNCDMNNVYSVGNAAGDGAIMALLNIDKRHEAEIWARKVEYLELALDPYSGRMSVEALWLPHKEDKFPHLRHMLADARQVNKIWLVNYL